MTIGTNIWGLVHDTKHMVSTELGNSIPWFYLVLFFKKAS